MGGPRQDDGAAVIERLANVIYWLSCAAAVLIGCFVAALGVFEPDPGPVLLPIAAVIAAVLWLFGRLVRYVLAGR